MYTRLDQLNTSKQTSHVSCLAPLGVIFYPLLYALVQLLTYFAPAYNELREKRQNERERENN
jgi:hypothetical protein